MAKYTSQGEKNPCAAYMRNLCWGPLWQISVTILSEVNGIRSQNKTLCDFLPWKGYFWSPQVSLRMLSLEAELAALFCASAPSWGTDFSASSAPGGHPCTPCCHFRHFPGSAVSPPGIPLWGRHRQQPAELLTNEAPPWIFISLLVSWAAIRGFSGLRPCGMLCYWSGFFQGGFSNFGLQPLAGCCNHCPLSFQVSRLHIKGWFCWKSVSEGEMCGPVLTEEEAFACLLTKKQRCANQYYWKTLKTTWSSYTSSAEVHFMVAYGTERDN